jgi:hypothetical protein
MIDKLSILNTWLIDNENEFKFPTFGSLNSFKLIKPTGDLCMILLGLSGLKNWPSHQLNPFANRLFTHFNGFELDDVMDTINQDNKCLLECLIIPFALENIATKRLHYHDLLKDYLFKKQKQETEFSSAELFAYSLADYENPVNYYKEELFKICRLALQDFMSSTGYLLTHMIFYASGMGNYRINVFESELVLEALDIGIKRTFNNKNMDLLCELLSAKFMLVRSWNDFEKNIIERIEKNIKHSDIIPVNYKINGTKEKSKFKNCHIILSHILLLSLYKSHHQEYDNSSAYCDGIDPQSKDVFQFPFL